MTPFSAMIKITGMTCRETAEYLQISEGTVNAVVRGKATAVKAETLVRLMGELRELHEAQRDAFLDCAGLIDGRSTIALRVASGDSGAIALGWPCRSAQTMVAAMVVAQHDVKFLMIEPGQQADGAVVIDVIPPRMLVT